MAEEPKIEEASSTSAVVQVKGAAEEKVQEQEPPAPPEESKALVVVENAGKPEATGGREASIRRIETEKRTSLINAWEENEKAKAENRAATRLAGITSWEKSKVAHMEAELKKTHERMEMEKAAKVEKLKNAAAAVRREAEEKRAAAEARRGEEFVRVEEAAARYRDREQAPTRIFGAGLFGS